MGFAASTAGATDGTRGPPGRFELWLQGSYAVAPLVVDPLGSVGFRFRQDTVPHVRLGVEAGVGLACLESCRASTAWVFQVPVAADVAFVVAPGLWTFELAAGYGAAPSAPIGDGALRVVHGPLVALRAVAPRTGGAALAASVGAQLEIVSPSGPYETALSLVLGPRVGVVF